MSSEKQIIRRVVEQFVRTGVAGDEQVKVICLPDNKTSFVEQVSGEGRSVMLDEYCVEARTIWAGFSGPNQTVYLSAVKG